MKKEERGGTPDDPIGDCRATEIFFPCEKIQHRRNPAGDVGQNAARPRDGDRMVAESIFGKADVFHSASPVRMSFASRKIRAGASSA